MTPLFSFGAFARRLFLTLWTLSFPSCAHCHSERSEESSARILHFVQNDRTDFQNEMDGL